MSIKPLTDKERAALRVQFERQEARNRKNRIYMTGYRARKREALRASNLDLISKL
jgi:hypothetical protein